MNAETRRLLGVTAIVHRNDGFSGHAPLPHRCLCGHLYADRAPGDLADHIGDVLAHTLTLAHDGDLERDPAPYVWPRVDRVHVVRSPYSHGDGIALTWAPRPGYAQLPSSYVPLAPGAPGLTPGAPVDHHGPEPEVGSRLRDRDQHLWVRAAAGWTLVAPYGSVEHDTWVDGPCMFPPLTVAGPA